MYTASDNVEIMIGNETDGIVKNLFEFFLQKSREILEKSIKGSDFFLVPLIYYITNFLK